MRNFGWTPTGSRPLPSIDQRLVPYRWSPPTPLPLSRGEHADRSAVEGRPGASVRNVAAGAARGRGRGGAATAGGSARADRERALHALAVTVVLAVVDERGRALGGERHGLGGPRL